MLFALYILLTARVPSLLPKNEHVLHIYNVHAAESVEIYMEP